MRINLENTKILQVLNWEFFKYADDSITSVKAYMDN
jgi:hypothetical protein